VLGAVAFTMRSQTAQPKPAALAARIAVIAMHDAMLATQEGESCRRLQTTWPQAHQARKDDAILALDEQLKKGAATMSCRRAV
jgi:hypothetical protein